MRKYQVPTNIGVISLFLLILVINSHPPIFETSSQGLNQEDISEKTVALPISTHSPRFEFQHLKSPMSLESAKDQYSQTFSVKQLPDYIRQ